uniref:Uncharacterized protein n=1 Tax=Heterorhabditis bacteriophora TaxID=37862 RepID=A0A1I7XI15_HETBA
MALLKKPLLWYRIMDKRDGEVRRGRVAVASCAIAAGDWRRIVHTSLRVSLKRFRNSPHSSDGWLRMSLLCVTSKSTSRLRHTRSTDSLTAEYQFSNNHVHIDCFSQKGTTSGRCW